MAYNQAETQPERTSFAWTRTSLALLVGTLWVCRSAFLTASPIAWLVIALSSAGLIANYGLIRVRRKKLQKGLAESTTTGLAKTLLVLQVLVIGFAALAL